MEQIDESETVKRAFGTASAVTSCDGCSSQPVRRAVNVRIITETETSHFEAFLEHDSVSHDSIKLRAISFAWMESNSDHNTWPYPTHERFMRQKSPTTRTFAELSHQNHSQLSTNELLFPSLFQPGEVSRKDPQL